MYGGVCDTGRRKSQFTNVLIKLVMPLGNWFSSPSGPPEKPREINLRTNEGMSGDIRWLLVPIVQSEGLSDCIISKVIEAYLELVAAAVVGIKN